MPESIRLISAASADLVAAHDWYEQQSPGLGKDFVRMVDVHWPVSRDTRNYFLLFITASGAS